MPIRVMPGSTKQMCGKRHLPQGLRIQPFEDPGESKILFSHPTLEKNHKSLFQSGLSPGAASHTQEGTINTGKMEEGVGEGCCNAERWCWEQPGAKPCCSLVQVGFGPGVFTRASLQQCAEEELPRELFPVLNIKHMPKSFLLAGSHTRDDDQPGNWATSQAHCGDEKDKELSWMQENHQTAKWEMLFGGKAQWILPSM